MLISVTEFKYKSWDEGVNNDNGTRCVNICVIICHRINMSTCQIKM